MMSSLRTMVSLPALLAHQPDPEHIVLTRKFIEGMLRYKALWPGPVKAILAPCDAETLGTNLDYVTVQRSELPFEAEVCVFERKALEPKLAGSSLVLAGPDYRLPYLTQMCDAAQVPCVNVTEYTLETRLQIARLNHPKVLRFMRTAAWELNQERLNRRTIANAAGVQCNGTPTFNRYRSLSPNPLLFFDTRTERGMYATAEDMEQRASRLFSGRPLTLAFSGRLVAMKGAEDLIEVARHLKLLGFPFRMLIAGEGESLENMQRRAQELQLTEVEFLGVLSFDKELMPLVRREVDLFVCCHRQGDPSCTYLETMAAGVPIAGFDNEAFKGLLELAEIGVSARLGNAQELAMRITLLTRSRLWECAKNALQFASKHDFESTFERRVAHMLSIADGYQQRHGSLRPLPVLGLDG